MLAATTCMGGPRPARARQSRLGTAVDAARCVHTAVAPGACVPWPALQAAPAMPGAEPLLGWPPTKHRRAARAAHCGRTTAALQSDHPGSSSPPLSTRSVTARPLGAGAPRPPCPAQTHGAQAGAPPWLPSAPGRHPGHCAALRSGWGPADPSPCRSAPLGGRQGGLGFHSVHDNLRQLAPCSAGGPASQQQKSLLEGACWLCSGRTGTRRGDGAWRSATAAPTCILAALVHPHRLAAARLQPPEHFVFLPHRAHIGALLNFHGSLKGGGREQAAHGHRALQRARRQLGCPQPPRTGRCREMWQHQLCLRCAHLQRAA